MKTSEKRVVRVLVESNTCGKVILRPNNDNAALFLKLTRNKSLTEQDIETIISLGYTIEAESGS
jgi:hypothetical protein